VEQAAITRAPTAPVRIARYVVPPILPVPAPAAAAQPSFGIALR
jgi:hypothetical protein